MITELLKREKAISVILVMLPIPYVAVAFSYSVIEFEGPFLFLFLPAVGGVCMVFAGAAINERQAVLKSLRVGGQIGFVLSIALFLSNIAFSAPYKDGYVVSEILQGRGEGIIWVV